MSFAPYVAAAFGLAFGLTGALSIMPKPKPLPFLEVHSITYADEQITAERTIHGALVDGKRQGGYADWVVTITEVGGEAPKCNTVVGENMHEGWSFYEIAPKQKSVMQVDEWVNGPGCYDRLEPGPHQIATTWTARYGSPAIAHFTTFTKPGGD